MLVPLSWLKEYVDIDVEAKELEEKLFSCGFEVEESYEVGKDISGVVVGLVEECEPIPETHLHVCKVNVGGADLLWCGQRTCRRQISCSTGRCAGIRYRKRSCDHRRHHEDQKRQAAWL